MVNKLIKSRLYSLCFGTTVALTMSVVGIANANPLPKSLTDKVTKKVELVESQNSAFDINLLTSRFASWGISPTQNNASINLEEAWQRFKKKKEVVVAVIDTGIDPSHPFLYENILVKEGNSSSTNYGVDFSKDQGERSRPKDTHGHGTHVSGIIKSVFPAVKILTLKYYNPKASGQDNLNSTIKALRYAVEKDVDIINYSGGGPEPALEELRILKEAEKKGILIVAAAGNEESNIDYKNNAYYPASYGLKNIITVTAHDQNLRLLSSSNYGKVSVDISAPGYRIRSSLPNSRAGYLTGTSQATAFVSGIAALIKSNYPSLSATEIKEIIRSSAKKEITLLTKCNSGGRADASRAHRLAEKYLKAKGLKRTLANTKKTSSKKDSKIHYRLSK